MRLRGNDKIIGGSGVDTFYGQDGNDHLYGYRGNDVLDGGDGNDRIVGGLGDDTISGGAGNDYVLAQGLETIQSQQAQAQMRFLGALAMMLSRLMVLVIRRLMVELGRIVLRSIFLVIHHSLILAFLMQVTHLRLLISQAIQSASRI